MKRGGRLRRKSKTNSRPFTDVALRDEYRDQHRGACEVHQYIQNIIRLPEPKGIELHHLWSLGRRPDVWANMICVTDSFHDWAHDNLTLNRVVCMYSKWRKQGKDWNPEELNRAAGKNALGWLSTLTLYGAFDDMRNRILFQEEP